MSVRAPAEASAARRGARVGAAAAVTLAALSAAVLLHAGPLFAFDAAISGAARHLALAHPAWRAAMAAVTVTGSTMVLWPLAVAGCLALLVARRWRQAAFVAVALPVTLAVRLVLVTSIARPRPADRVAAASGWSFPSGHSTASAAAALVVALVLWPLLRHRWSRVLTAVLTGGWAVAVGVSRVALVVHWPADVVGAWLLVLTLVPTLAVLMKVAAPLDQAGSATAPPETTVRRPEVPAPGREH